MSIMSVLHTIETDALAALESLFKTEVAALTPIATAIVTNSEAAIVQAAATGKLSSLGATLGSVLSQTGAEAEVAGITAGAQSLAGSVLAALAANPKVAAATTAPAPAP